MTKTYTYPILSLKLLLYATIPKSYLLHGPIGLLLALSVALIFIAILGNEHTKRNRNRVALNKLVGLNDDFAMQGNPSAWQCYSHGWPLVIFTAW